MHEISHPGSFRVNLSDFIKTAIHFSIFMQISLLAFAAQLSSQLLPPASSFFFFKYRLMLQSMDQMQE